MSCNESKTVIRAEFPQLQGQSRQEVFSFYRNVLGEPDELEEWDGKVEYFDYKGMYQPVFDYETERWGIDLVLHHESDYTTYIEMQNNGLSLREFEAYAHQMAEKFQVDSSKVRLMSYTWYNGSDEPILFD